MLLHPVQPPLKHHRPRVLLHRLPEAQLWAAASTKLALRMLHCRSAPALRCPLPRAFAATAARSPLRTAAATPHRRRLAPLHRPARASHPSAGAAPPPADGAPPPLASAVAAVTAAPPAPASPLSSGAALLRRLAFAAVTLRVALFTPAPALATSLLLGVLGVVLASRPAVMAAIAATAAALPPPPAPGATAPSPLLRGATLSRSATLAVGAAVFILSGLLEIGGGWLVWRHIRCGAPRYFAVIGSGALVAYGFVAALQPMADFGRAYAIYGAYFVGMSIAWGAALDGFRPDAGDAIGCALVAAGVAVMTAWPRGSV